MLPVFILVELFEKNFSSGSIIGISIFHRKSADFSVSRNTDIDCILKQFLTLSTVFESLKIVLINMVTILMMSAKIATLGLLEMWVF